MIFIFSFYDKGATNKLAASVRSPCQVLPSSPCVNIRQARHSTDWWVKVTASHQMLQVTYGKRQQWRNQKMSVAAVTVKLTI